jgi:hypothetical protein
MCEPLSPGAGQPAPPSSQPKGSSLKKKKKNPPAGEAGLLVSGRAKAWSDSVAQACQHVIVRQTGEPHD